MSHHMTSAVFQCFYAGGNLRLVALALADACGDDSGENIFLAVDTVAQMADVNRSTVQRSMARLLREGWLLRDGGNVGGRGRTNTYNINPDWITAVAVERARARQAGQRAGKVLPPAPRAQADVEGCGSQTPGHVAGVVAGVVDKLPDGPLKGGKLPPFVEPERVANSTLKGGKKGLKGGIAVPPEQEQNTTIPPNPPFRDADGGLSDFFKLLEAEHPKAGPSDAKAARRQWRKLRRAGLLTPSRLSAMRHRLMADKRSPQWQSEGGRFIKNFSAWLGGWAAGWEEPVPEQPANIAAKQIAPRVVLSPEELAANKARAVAARAALGAMRGRVVVAGQGAQTGVSHAG